MRQDHRRHADLRTSATRVWPRLLPTSDLVHDFSALETSGSSTKHSKLGMYFRAENIFSVSERWTWFRGCATPGLSSFVYSTHGNLINLMYSILFYVCTTIDTEVIIQIMHPT